MEIGRLFERMHALGKNERKKEGRKETDGVGGWLAGRSGSWVSAGS